MRIGVQASIIILILCLVANVLPFHTEGTQAKAPAGATTEDPLRVCYDRVYYIEGGERKVYFRKASPDIQSKEWKDSVKKKYDSIYKTSAQKKKMSLEQYQKKHYREFEQPKIKSGRLCDSFGGGAVACFTQKQTAHRGRVSRKGARRACEAI